MRRLQHRACLALWCGNNEVEQGFVDWEAVEWSQHKMPGHCYRRLFDELLPRIVAEEDGVTVYWPSSSHTPGPNRKDVYDATSGEAHAWSVWFGSRPIEEQRRWRFRFMSEFGFRCHHGPGFLWRIQTVVFPITSSTCAQEKPTPFIAPERIFLRKPSKTNCAFAHC